MPWALANDVNAALYGEYRAGAGRGCRSLVMLALGTGVGGGVLVDGNLLIGAHCGAGELGHMVLDPDGPLCACGNRGCLEAWAGSRALLVRARELADRGGAFADLVRQRGGDLTTRDLAGLADGGDATARELFAEAGPPPGAGRGQPDQRPGPRAGHHRRRRGPGRRPDPGALPRDRAAGLVLAAGARETPVVAAELGN